MRSGALRGAQRRSRLRPRRSYAPRPGADNLVDNALKYTPRGGRVEIVTERIGDQSVLRVRDSGIGMPTELVPRIFDLFTQARRLSSARTGASPRPGARQAAGRAARRLGGGLERRCRRGQRVHDHAPGRGGATRRPAGASVGARDRARPRATSAGRRGQRRCAAGRAAPARAGGHVVEDRLRRSGVASPSSGHSIPDVALIDVGLPGMDGYALARAARSQARRATSASSPSPATDRRRTGSGR